MRTCLNFVRDIDLIPNRNAVLTPIGLCLIMDFPSGGHFHSMVCIFSRKSLKTSLVVSLISAIWTIMALLQKA
jgi:hypothetical protein